MSTYILCGYDITLPNGMKPYIMTADSTEELHKLAKNSGIPMSSFNNTSDSPFYIISKSQMKKAINNGCLDEAESKAMLTVKKKFPQMINR